MDTFKLLVHSLTRKLDRHLDQHNRDEVLMVGIHTGGLWVAEALYSRLNLTLPLGELNITFYRDDFQRIGLHPTVKPTTLPIDINDRHVILVDDVICSGRTIRAAHNALFDYGRPASIKLAVLVSRAGRELPIQPDFIGVELDLAPNEQLRLSNQAPFNIDIISL